MNHAALQALRQPLAVSDTWLRALMASVAANPAALALESRPVDDASDLTCVGSVGVVSITGPLSQEPGIWSLFGFHESTYSGIRRDLEIACADPNITAIVLNINSPGGDVYGCAELCGYIYGIRAEKPIYAYIGGQGDSAAYWLASACDQIVINESAEAGSIGVRCVLVDYSVLEKGAGISVYDIVADQSPLKVVDAAEATDRARVKAQMTAFASVFVSNVARNRGVSVDTVLSDFGKGDVFVGADAVDAGLADEVGTLESVIAELSAQPQENGMTIPKSAAAAAPNAPTAGVTNGKCSSCKADMGDGDPMYCKACMDADGDDDGDASKASAFVAAVTAIMGETDHAKLIGALTGMKAQAEKVAALESQIAAEKKKAADAEIKAQLDAACADGRVKPAGRAVYEKLYADYGAGALSAALSVLTPAPAPAEPGSDEAAREASLKTAPAVAAVEELTPEQLAVIKKTGTTVEAFIAHRKRLAAVVNPTEEN